MKPKDIAKQIISKMLPTSNTKGVGLDEPYYDQLVFDAAKEHGELDEILDFEVRSLLAEVAVFGFSVLD